MRGSEGIAQSVQQLPTGCTGRGSNPGTGRTLWHTFRQVLETHQTSCTVSFSGMQLPRHDGNLSRHQAPSLKESRAKKLLLFNCNLTEVRKNTLER